MATTSVNNYVLEILMSKKKNTIIKMDSVAYKTTHYTSDFEFVSKTFRH